MLPGFLPSQSPKFKKSRMLKRTISPEREKNKSKKPKLETPMKKSQNIEPENLLSNPTKQDEMEGKEEGEISDSDEDISTKAMETGIILLIDQVAAVIFVNLKKVSDICTSGIFFINSQNVSTNLNCCLNMAAAV